MVAIAQTEAAGAAQLSALLFEVPERAVGDGHLRVLRRAGAGQLQVINVAGVCDDAAAEAETDDEIFQIRRRHQHHRLTDAVVGDRQRDFLGERGAGRFHKGQIAVTVGLAGGGRGRLKCRRRASGALGVHGITDGLINAKTRRGNLSRLIATVDLLIDAVDQAMRRDLRDARQTLEPAAEPGHWSDWSRVRQTWSRLGRLESKSRSVRHESVELCERGR